MKKGIQVQCVILFHWYVFQKIEVNLFRWGFCMQTVMREVKAVMNHTSTSILIEKLKICYHYRRFYEKSKIIIRGRPKYFFRTEKFVIILWIL